jgi:hypothetical protein
MKYAFVVQIVLASEVSWGLDGPLVAREATVERIGVS